jgi:hypothetical protein
MYKKLSFICYNLFFIELSNFYDLDRKLSRSTWTKLKLFLCLFSIKIYQSHDLNHMLNMLIQVDFLIDFFQFHSSTLG